MKKLSRKQLKEARDYAKGCIARFDNDPEEKDKDAFGLAMLISERVEYFSDRWSNDGIRFEVIRIMLNECEKRWMAECRKKR